MEDVHNYIGSAIQQDDVPPNQYVRAIRGRRRQLAFQILRARLDPFLKPWRKRAAPRQLLFQARGQLVSLGESRRKIALVAVIPSANHFTVMVFIEMLSLIVVISMFAVALPMSVALSDCGTCSDQKKA